jgi:hypothetical protein
MCGRGTSRREICEKKGSSQQTKKKRKKIEKKAHLAAALHLTFVSEKAQCT